MKNKVTIDKTSQNTKPKPNDIKVINSRLTAAYEVTVEEFAGYVSQPLGYTWCPAVFNGTRKNANWLNQSVFALDFDDGMTPDEALKVLATYNLTPNVIYTSFSDSPALRKFRVVFFLDTLIDDATTAKFIILNLMNLFDGRADKACKDYARLFFAGKDVVHLCTELIDTQKLIDVLNTVVIASDAGKTRKCQKLAENVSSYIYNIETDAQHQKEEIRDFDFKKLESEVTLFREFMQGSWLTHPQIFGLATALHWVRGGAKLMRDTMNKYNGAGKTHYTENNFACLTYVRYAKYQPQRLSNYSPYEEDYDLHNPIKAVLNQRGDILQTEQIIKISLAEAEETMKSKFNEILNNDDRDSIYILKLPTGIGKTQMLQTTNAVIALPTNKLKDEVYDRVTIEKVKTPELPVLEDTALKDRLDYLYSVGLNEVAFALIQSICHGGEGTRSISDREALRAYLSDLRVSYSRDNSAVLTTHRRAVFSKFKHNTIIFDEDPSAELLNIKTFNIADFLKLEGQRDLFNKSEISDIVDYLRAQPRGIVFETPQFTIDIEDLCSKMSSAVLTSDIVSFFNSNYFFRNGSESNNPNLFSYITKTNLPENKKIIILSATAPISVYKAIYGDKVKVLDLSDVEHVGNIIQNTRWSFSRNSLNTAVKNISKVADTSRPSITFKSFINNIPNAIEDMYFGNVSGYDSLKGKDINVIGTPHLNNSVYLLISNCMGMRLKPKDMVMSFRKITRNGFSYSFNAFHNETLMDLQLSMIESELLQAVGRARTLREDCTVHLYSNLPLRITTKFTR